MSGTKRGGGGGSGRVRKHQKKGVFVLESDWNRDLRKPATVEPLFQFLDQSYRIPSVHRHVGVITQLVHYLDTWCQARYQNYPILYLGFHGHPGTFECAQENGRVVRHTLEELAGWLQGRCRGRYIHIAGCHTLNVPKRSLRAFLETTGAAAVSGFTKEIEWAGSGAFDLLLLTHLQQRAFNRVGFQLVERDLLAEAPGLAERLGFKMMVI